MKIGHFKLMVVSMQPFSPVDHLQLHVKLRHLILLSHQLQAYITIDAELYVLHTVLRMYYVLTNYKLLI